MLKGKRIIITGASGGIGGAIARRCAAEGATVGLGYFTRAVAAKDLASEIERDGGEALPLGFDVCDEASISAQLERFTKSHGGLDAWVHAAGVATTGLLAATTEVAVRRQLEGNLLGPMLCARAALPVMMRAKKGVLLFLSSVAAVRASRGQAVYAATKGGLEAFARALAVEYAKKGIRSLCLRPGAVDTPMLSATRTLGEDELLSRIPQRRVATPIEIADYAAFLLSDRAAYVTGTEATIDGGYLQG